MKFLLSNILCVIQVVIEIPYIFVQTIVYGIIVYAMIGFEWTIVKFFWYLFFMYFTFLYFTFYGMMTVAVTPNHNFAAIISSAFYAIWNLFSGFIVPKTVSFSNFKQSCLSLLRIWYKASNFLLQTSNRGYPYGGDGIIIYVRLHGHYTD